MCKYYIYSIYYINNAPAPCFGIKDCRDCGIERCPDGPWGNLQAEVLLNLHVWSQAAPGLYR